MKAGLLAISEKNQEGAAMAYDSEKYRNKREKVLGVKKRGLNFGTLAAIISLIIVLGLGIVIVPRSVAFFNTRHLDDAIYKMKSGDWAQETIPDILNLAGVKDVVTDNNGSRIVITFDKTITDAARLSAYFEQRGIQTIMLNRISHHQRMTTLKKEAAL